MWHSFYSGKKILVAGGSGFVGSHLTEALFRMGAQVRSTFHSTEPREIIESVEYIKADLLRAEDCLMVTKDVDFVFMCAANSSGAAVMEHTPLAHLTPNLIMNSQMLASAYENRVDRFCFISSNTVYPLTDYAVKESDARYEFYDKYFIVGWMKRFSEIMCEIYSDHIKVPMQSVTIRPGNLYGPFDKFNKMESKVVAALIRRAIEGEDPFSVWGDGSDIKDFLYISDFIEGLLLAFEKAQDCEPINIASGNPVAIRDLINVILEVTNHTPTSVIFDSSKPTMIPKRMIDISKMKRMTGWHPKTDLVSGITTTVDWYRKVFSINSPEEVEL